MFIELFLALPDDGIWILALGLASGIAIGFERYRSHFRKSDLFLAVASFVGLCIVLLIGLSVPVGGIVDGTFDAEWLGLVVALSVGLYVLRRVRSVEGSVRELVRNLAIESAPVTDGGEGTETIFVIVPAYNEEDSVGDVVAKIPERVHGRSVQPVVVSDGSSDHTARRAAVSGSRVVEHPVNQGQGGALKTGFEVADRSDTSIIVTMDADGQHPPNQIADLVAPIVDGEADFVKGSRDTGLDRSENGITRRLGIRAFTALINVLTKADLTDCTNGFRAIRGTDLARLELAEERFSAPELIIEARKKGLRLMEIPVRIERRTGGRTKKPRLGYAVGLTRTILATWIR